MSEKQDDVIQLSFRDAVRQRSGMYIGSTENPSVCLREIVDNSIDECYVSKSCDKVFIFNNADSAVVIDNGRGIPVKKMKNAEVTMARSSITSAHSGSKFNKDSAQVGMNGIGSSAVNMLSKKYILVVKIDESTINESTNDVCRKFNAKRASDKGQLFYALICETGIVKSEDVISFTELKNLVPEVGDVNVVPGTLVKFWPDPSIFDEVKMIIPNSLRYFKYISKVTQNKNVDVYINGKIYEDNFTPYKYEVKSTVKTDVTWQEPKNKEATFLFSFEFDEDFDHYSNQGSVNGLSVNQGHHIWLSTQAFRKAYQKVFPGYDYKGNEVKGINFCTIILCAEPSFSSQTKERMSGCPGIGDSCIGPFVNDIVKVIKANIQEFSVHQKKVVEYNLKMADLSKIDYIKSKVPILAEVGERRTAAMTPVKLRGCTTKNREEAELYLCFPGETKILTCNDEKLSFFEVRDRLNKGEQLYTFSCDSDGTIYPAKIIDCDIVRSTNEFIEIELDNGEIFECTPDHKHLMLNGEYKRADELSIGDSLMPCYISYVDTYNYDGQYKRRVIRSKTGKYKFRPVDGMKDTHYVYRIMSMHQDTKIKSNELTSLDTHHIDDKPIDDRPINLEKVSKKWHRAHHGGLSLLEHYNNGEFNNFYGCNESKRQSIILSQQKRWNSENSDKERLKYRENAIKEWSDKDLRNWKSEDVKRWNRENPDKLREKQEKSRSTYIKNLAINTIKYIEDNNLEKLATIFESVMSKISPTKYFSYYTVLRRFPELLVGFRDDKDDEYINWINKICSILESKSLPLTKETFSKISYEVDKHVVRSDSYANYKKWYPELFKAWELKLNNNHKIVNIRRKIYDINKDAWCLTVDNELHNFPLACGIFTANCEGLSAEGSLAINRDPRIHASIPLRGRPQNAASASVEQILENQEIRDIIAAIGTGIDDYFNLDRIQYGKIIILSDADPDGKAIAALLIGLFLSHMKYLVKEGMVYVCDTPLYEQEGNLYYIGDEDKLDKSKPIRRFKGLGELPDDIVKKTIFDPNTRKLIRVTLDDVDKALSLVTSTYARKQLMIDSGIIYEY